MFEKNLSFLFQVYLLNCITKIHKESKTRRLCFSAVGRTTLSAVHDDLFIFSVTDSLGQYSDFIQQKDANPGRYKLHFDIDRYFALRRHGCLYPFVEVSRFNLAYFCPDFGIYIKSGLISKICKNSQLEKCICEIMAFFLKRE